MKAITKVLIVSGLVVGLGVGIYFYKKNKGKLTESKDEEKPKDESKSGDENKPITDTEVKDIKNPVPVGVKPNALPMENKPKPSPEKAVDNLVTIMYGEMNRVKNFFKSSRVSQDSAALISAKYIKQVNKATDFVRGKKLNDSQKDKMLAIILYKTQLSNKLKSSGFVLANKGNQYLLANVKTPNKQVAVV